MTIAKPKPQNTVLIVDDIPTNLSVLFQYLRNTGFRVLVAEDGEHALKQIGYIKPDLILLDVMMPGIDGFETCRQLKNNEATKDIPVIFMTALSETVDKVRGFELGAVDYVTKPVQAEEVLARINAHLMLQDLQRGLRQQIDERDKLIAELDAFSSTVAHDLKSPLGVVLGYLDYIVEYLPQLEQKEIADVLQDVKSAAHRLDRIVDELLMLSSVRKGQVDLTPVDMYSIILQVHSRLAHMIEEYQAEVVWPETWPIAMGHAPWIEEVWANYLTNALKYGGTPPLVKLGANKVDEADMIRFWIQDNGNGIPDEQKSKLFTEFTRLETRRAKGHGLGLSIVRRIVEKLGGEVGVDSLPGEGTTFYFSLPVADYTMNDDI